MTFSHHPAIWSRFPELAAGVLHAEGVHDQADVAAPGLFLARARERLAAAGSESELPEIQAWRRVFSRMGLKPTQYRCASESLLRRLRKEGAPPPIHPLIDLCNAASMAFAIPIAVFDLDRVAQGLEVREADGTETYLTFSGEAEHPDPGEVVFADAAGHAHARRWSHRQSGLSSIQPATRRVLVVAEAMHASGAADVRELMKSLEQALRERCGCATREALLTAQAPRFEF